MNLSWCLVSILDILGFKEDIRKDLRSGKTAYGDRLKEAMDNAISQIPDNLFEYQTISDTIIIMSKPDIDCLNEKIFFKLFFSLKTIAIKFLEKDIFIRGGVDCGYQSKKDYFTYSLPITYAHLLEKNMAIFPRIILSDNVLQLLDSTNYVNDIQSIHQYELISEQNGVKFINILDDDNWERIYLHTKGMYQNSFRDPPSWDYDSLCIRENRFVKHLWFENYLFNYKEKNKKESNKRYIKMNLF